MSNDIVRFPVVEMKGIRIPQDLPELWKTKILPQAMRALANRWSNLVANECSDIYFVKEFEQIRDMWFFWYGAELELINPVNRFNNLNDYDQVTVMFLFDKLLGFYRCDLQIPGELFMVTSNV